MCLRKNVSPWINGSATHLSTQIGSEAVQGSPGAHSVPTSTKDCKRAHSAMAPSASALEQIIFDR